MLLVALTLLFLIFLLYLIFVRLINIYFSMFLFGCILYRVLCFLDLGDYFLSHIREVFDYNLLKHFLTLFLFFFWDPYKSNVSAFNVVPRVSEIVFISFHSFFFILFCESYFHQSIFQFTYPFFCLNYCVIDSF